MLDNCSVEKFLKLHVKFVRTVKALAKRKYVRYNFKRKTFCKSHDGYGQFCNGQRTSVLYLFRHHCVHHSVVCQLRSCLTFHFYKPRHCICSVCMSVTLALPDAHPFFQHQVASMLHDIRCWSNCGSLYDSCSDA